MKSFLLSIWEIVEVGLIAVITVVVVRHFLVQPFVVFGRSMEPNFSQGDYLLIDEISYHYRIPQRGEVVVFRSPDKAAEICSSHEPSFFIKRIIGLPEEKISIKNNQIMIFNKENPDGFKLPESYLTSIFDSSLIKMNGMEIQLDKGEYFVVGDNRSESCDSRSWGPVQKSAIVGLVRLRLWPLTKVSAIEYPIY